MNKRLGRLLRPSMGMYFVFLFAFCAIALMAQQYLFAMVEIAVSALLFAAYLLDKKERRRRLQHFARKLANEQAGVRNGEPPFPMLLMRLSDGGVIYANDAFHDISDLEDGILERQIEDVVPDFRAEWLVNGKTEYPSDITLRGHRYRVYGNVVKADDPDHTALGMLYFADLTDLYQIRDEYIRSRPVVSIILVDNYDEMTRSLTESATSALNARINEAITAWTEGYHGILRRLEKNRFLFVFEKKDLKSAKDSKFSVLESINSIVAPSGLPVSVSIGMGVDGESFEESYDFASLAIDMALSRGGDQAVIKDRYNFEFYGGNNKETEQRSKVNSRVSAESLMNLVSQCSQVFIMGHSNADLDSVGAAVGVRCLCRKWGVDAKIILDLEHNASGALLEEILATPEYKDAFITGLDAQVECDGRSVLVVVDTNRPAQVEFMPILESFNHICVIDHHRRAADYINPVAVNLHAPYASSASELVTELLQYSVERKDVLPIEAKSLLAGIYLDTKSFHVRTGERTFEAAAYLRELGADPVEVKLLLRNDYNRAMIKYKIIMAARGFYGDHALVALDGPVPRELAAQAADELLNISVFNASFVMYPDGNRVIVSARSIGKTNVHAILEPLGGGGNAATAGAQIDNAKVSDIHEFIKQAIIKYYEQ